MPDGYGADRERGWGKRFSVAQDYLFEHPVMLGNLRMGPDLANIGVRQTNEVWHFLHLYDPQITMKGSTMPPYAYLFERRRVAGQLSPGALPLPGEAGGPSGFEIVPKPEARALVAYLQSLQAEAPLFEAPLPKKEEPDAQEGTTNAPPDVGSAPASAPGGTNAAATNQAPAQ
jgi:cytochrome c oxidase cbb3-type subunit 2